MAENVPSMEAIFRFSNLIADRSEDLQLAGERVRSLAYNKNTYVRTVNTFMLVYKYKGN